MRHIHSTETTRSNCYTFTSAEGGIHFFYKKTARIIKWEPPPLKSGDLSHPAVTAVFIACSELRGGSADVSRPGRGRQGLS